MKRDDEVCLCFHVTLRKLENFLRIERPHRAAQLSECHGAGTGCGWCRPYLQRLFEQHQAAQVDTEAGRSEDLPTAEQYAAGRAAYRAKLADLRRENPSDE